VGVNPTNAATHQAVALYKCQHFIVAALGQTGQVLKQEQYFGASTPRAARQLANDERVAFDFSAIQQNAEITVAPAEMVHPNGSINQHNGGFYADAAGAG
jgi:hypothetical protein